MPIRNGFDSFTIKFILLIKNFIAHKYILVVPIYYSTDYCNILLHSLEAFRHKSVFECLIIIPHLCICHVSWIAHVDCQLRT